MTLRVLKLGGSLLDVADLPARLAGWLARQPAAANVLVAGGGALVDVIRRADRIHALGELVSHELAIEALGVTARLAQATALVRDLVNLGSSDMGPADLEAEAEKLAKKFDATITVTRGASASEPVESTRPTGFCPGQNRRAASSFTMPTSGAP